MRSSVWEVEIPILILPEGSFKSGAGVGTRLGKSSAVKVSEAI